MTRRAPAGLIEAMKISTAAGVPMRPEHIQGTKDWIFEFMDSQDKQDSQAQISTHEIALLAHALSSCIYVLSTIANERDLS